MATRGSELALAQTRWVVGRLREAHPGLEVEERVVRTAGDAVLDRPLAEAGRLEKGLFTGALEEALLRGEADFAVHSLKDLPVAETPGLGLAAVPPREVPWDVLVVRRGCAGRVRQWVGKLGERCADVWGRACGVGAERVAGGMVAMEGMGGEGVVLGTGSPRRDWQVRRLLPGAVCRWVRGNVPTRLRKAAREEGLDGVVLAAAGLVRLGLCTRELVWTASGGEAWDELEIVGVPGMLPAPGQGALAVQARADDEEVRGLLRVLHCEVTAACVGAERALLGLLGGGCHLALGALAEACGAGGDGMVLRAVFFEQEGADAARGREAEGRWVARFGEVEGRVGEPVEAARRLVAGWLGGNGAVEGPGRGLPGCE